MNANIRLRLTRCLLTPIAIFQTTKSISIPYISHLFLGYSNNNTYHCKALNWENFFRWCSCMRIMTLLQSDYCIEYIGAFIFSMPMPSVWWCNKALQFCCCWSSRMPEPLSFTLTFMSSLSCHTKISLHRPLCANSCQTTASNQCLQYVSMLTARGTSFIKLTVIHYLLDH